MVTSLHAEAGKGTNAGPVAAFDTRVEDLLQLFEIGLHLFIS
jgi:hypothetical protein